MNLESDSEILKFINPNDLELMKTTYDAEILKKIKMNVENFLSKMEHQLVKNPCKRLFFYQNKGLSVDELFLFSSCLKKTLYSYNWYSNVDVGTKLLANGAAESFQLSIFPMQMDVMK